MRDSREMALFDPNPFKPPSTTTPARRSILQTQISFRSPHKPTLNDIQKAVDAHLAQYTDGNPHKAQRLFLQLCDELKAMLNPLTDEYNSMRQRLNVLEKAMREWKTAFDSASGPQKWAVTPAATNARITAQENEIYMLRQQLEEAQTEARTLQRNCRRVLAEREAAHRMETENLEAIFTDKIAALGGSSKF